MNARRTIVVVLLVALLGGAGAFAALRSADGARQSGGPLGSDGDLGYFGVGGATDVGRPLSVGLLVIENRGRASATLEDVSLDGAPPALRVVGNYVQPRAVAPGIGLVEGFPPANPGPLRSPVRDYRVPAGTTVQIVVGLAPSRNGTFTSRAFLVDYRVGNVAYRAEWPIGVRVCAPKRRYFGKCPAPQG
jgi:hypothetical protein